MKITNKDGNLFSSNTKLKCQCISADLNLNGKTEKDFNRCCNVQNKLTMELNLNTAKLAATFQKSNGFCIYYDGVFNLITKEKCSDKTTYEHLTAAVIDMANCIRGLLDMGLIPDGKIAMPELGLDNDALEWDKIQDILEKELASLPIEIEVWHNTKEICIGNPGFEIKTGYFAMTKRYKEAGYYPVSIARHPPKSIECGHAEIFAPPEDLLRDYKNNVTSDNEYDTRYRTHLNSIPQRIWDRFAAYYEEKCRSEGYKGVVLMCFEKPGDMCHRAIFADYVQEKYGIKVNEFVMPKKTADKEYKQPLRQEDYER